MNTIQFNDGISVRMTHEGAATHVVLDCPERHNAFDDALIADLSEKLVEAGARAQTRVVVLTGAGASFSAGADLGWMRRMASAGAEDNLRDARALARLMRTLYELPKTTIARVNGSAYGGGVGLIACCDIAIASDDARFGLTEAKLGLVPAVISPYVCNAIGARHARRYFQTAQIFYAAEAARIGLVHAHVVPGILDATVAAQIALALKTGPEAAREAKLLAMRMSGLDAAALDRHDALNVALIARLRASPEGREGLGAFLDKRRPAWQSDSP